MMEVGEHSHTGAVQVCIYNLGDIEIKGRCTLYFSVPPLARVCFPQDTVLRYPWIFSSLAPVSWPQLSGGGV